MTMRSATRGVGVRWAMRLAMLAGLVVASQAMAQGAASGSQPANDSVKQCGGNSAGDPAADCAGAGNPINVANGNKYQREVDLPALPGVLGLEIVRHYNSSLSRESEPNGIFGKGWRLGYEYGLFAVGHSYQLIEPDGRRLMFARSAFDPDVCVPSDPMKGRIRVTRKPEGAQYLWTLPSGRSLRFNARGQLEEIRVPSGEFLSLQYDPQGRLNQVIDPQGRRLVLSYPVRGAAGERPARFMGVASVHTPVGDYLYSYGSDLPKGSAASPATVQANLVSVSLPSRSDGMRVKRQYLYEDAAFPTLLTGLTVQSVNPARQVETQRLATYLYDSAGRARRSEHGLAVELQGLQPASPVMGARPGRVVLVHSQTTEQPQGRALEVLSQQIAGQYRITQTRGQPCPARLNCPQANVRYEYDRLGRMTKAMAHAPPEVRHANDGWRFGPLGPMLGAQRFELDGLGRVSRHWQVTAPTTRRGEATHREVLLEERSYDGLSDRVRMVRRSSVVKGRWHEWRVKYNDRGQPEQLTESGWQPAVGSASALALDRSVSFSYQTVNGRSVLAAVDGPLAGSADTTRYDWDERGSFVRSIRAPLGLVHRFERDPSGRVVMEVPSDGVPIQHGHLPTGEEASWQRGLARVSVMHDALGRPVRIDMPDGEVQRLAYEAQTGAVASVKQDGAMRWIVPPSLSEVPDAAALGATSHFEPAVPAPWEGQRAWVDDFGQLVALQTTVTGLETRAYDANRRIVTRRLADGTVWRWRRDALGRIVRHEATRPGASAIVTTLTYEGVHLVRLDHPTESEAFRHDVWGRVAERTVHRPATGALPAQHWVERFSYDPADRLLRHELPEGGVLSYAWGAGPQLRRIEHDDGRLSDVLGSRLAGWLGAGRQVLIEPLAVPGRALPLPADASTPERLQAQRQIEQGYQWGNGVALRWHLNSQGQIGELRYSAPSQRTAWWRPLLKALPVGEAQAAATEAASWMGWTYRYDAHGRMLSRGDTHYAYDDLGQLLVAQPASTGRVAEADFYAYVGARRVASREQGQRHDEREVRIERTPSGLPAVIHQGERARVLRYSADHRLLEVSEGGRRLALYGHNTHGQRISKQAGSGAARTFLWNQGQLAAEGHGQGIDRRYVYARGVPVAVIDHPDGATAARQGEGAWAEVLHWAWATWRLVSQTAPQVTYLHGNEIGTPVAATDARGRVVWKAEHSAFGALRAVQRSDRSPPGVGRGFELNLRLPGQYFDEETGWHDNVRRTYDPHSGAYLEPDPLGPVPNWGRGGRRPWLTQPFAYAGYNPVTHADPSGLILFAFDGTGNSDPAQSGSSLSNVRKFFLSYDQTVNGEAFYITGIGTINKDMPIKGSEATGTGFRERLNLGTRFLEQFINADAANSGTWLDVDVVGFSRGAAEARAWVSEIEKQLSASREFASNNTGKNRRCINFRFLGVWDTVPHLGADHGDEKDYDFSIPASVKLAVHAVAVNEHRGGLADFDVESIHANATVQNSGTRIERGFVGAHSDIGGGYAEGDLSDVALMWMIQNALVQGIAFDEEMIKNAGWDVVYNPIIHDSRIGQGFKEWLWLDGGDREMVYLNDTRVKQELARLPSGVTNTAKARESIQYFKAGCGDDGTIVGLVDVAKYKVWVSDIGLRFEPTPAVPQGCKPKN